MSSPNVSPQSSLPGAPATVLRLPFSVLHAPFSPGSRAGARLQSYFRSGWAFLIPYLAAYLLYAWLRWPVNPGAGEGNTENGAGSWVPCLLHVYCLFHALHSVLAAIALRCWRKESILDLQLFANVSEGITSENVGQTHVPRARGNSATSTGALGTSASGLQSPVSALQSHSSILPSPFSVLLKSAPWLLLALIFWIPGVYLEFPADPWQHYARINEWASLDLVSQHSAWAKSSYFLAYSLLGHITPPLRQLEWLDIYYTACCLLLCWQYYLLGLAVGLGKQAAFIFVLLQALLFGNNIFGFYRYYGISSSLFAQLGAVALTRIALEVLGTSKAEQGARSKGQGGRDPDAGERWLETGTDKAPSPPFRLPSTVFALLPRLPSPISDLLKIAGMSILLLPLIAFNHVQGLGIAGLGITAVVVWRLIEWQRSMISWLALTAVLSSIAMILWFPRHPALDEIYLPQKWLTSWYGLNLFAPNSPAFSHTINIVGIYGAISFIMGVSLLYRNHIAGWLSVMPIIALISPWFAIPLTSIIAAGEHGPDYIITYSRLLFSVPSGLSIIVLACILVEKSDIRKGIDIFQPKISTAAVCIRHRGLVAGVVLLAFLLVFSPPDFPFYNRLWHKIAVTPQDLEMRHVISAHDRLWPERNYRRETVFVFANQGISFVVESAEGRDLSRQHRSMGRNASLTPVATSTRLIQSLFQAKSGSQPMVILLPSATYVFTSFSTAGFLSQHWLPQQLALEHSATEEISAAARLSVKGPELSR